MTETGPAVITSHPLEAAADAMGTVTRWAAALELHDPGHGDRTAEAVTWARSWSGGGRGREIFAGYLDDPETTSGSFDGGWFRTGDLAYLDEAPAASGSPGGAAMSSKPPGRTCPSWRWKALGDPSCRF